MGCTNAPRTTAPSGVGPHACTTSAIRAPMALPRNTTGMTNKQHPKGFRAGRARFAMGLGLRLEGEHNGPGSRCSCGRGEGLVMARKKN